MAGPSVGDRRHLFAAGPASGGVSHGFTCAMRALDGRGWQVTMVQPSEMGSPARNALRTLLRNRRSLMRADAVHVEFGSNDRAAFWFAVLATVLRRDVTVFVHDYPLVVHTPAAGLLTLKGRARSVLAYRLLAPVSDRRLKRALLRRAGSVVVLSGLARDGWQGTARGPIVVVPHGDEEPAGDERPPSAGEYVLFAGFMGPGKGVDLLVDAWREVSASTELPLVFAGPASSSDQPWVERVRRRSESFSDPPIWRGAVESEREFQRLFADAAVVVLPYRRSSPASGILVRGMMQGRCIVASSVPAVVGTIRDGQEGLLFAPGDVHGLVEQLGNALRSAGLRDDLGRAARLRANELFSWEAHAAGLERAYGLARALR